MVDSISFHFKHFTCFAFAQFGSLLLSTWTHLSLGFPNYCIPHFTEQMPDRQADRYTDGLRQIDRRMGGINPWLWSRKQCQMLLVMSTYNHFVRHDSLRTSKYILYTGVDSVALTCQTSRRVSAQGTSDDNNCTKRYSGGHVYWEYTHTHTHTQTHTHRHTHTQTHSPPLTYTHSPFTFYMGGLIFRP